MIAVGSVGQSQSGLLGFRQSLRGVLVPLHDMLQSDGTSAAFVGKISRMTSLSQEHERLSRAYG